MKKNRTLRGLAIAAAALVGIYVGSTALAQNKPAGAAAPLRTRVAFLNLHETLKNYNKVKALREEMKGKEEEFMKTLKAKLFRLGGNICEARLARLLLVRPIADERLESHRPDLFEILDPELSGHGVFVVDVADIHGLVPPARCLG